MFLGEFKTETAPENSLDQVRRSYSYAARIAEKINQELAKEGDISIINLVDWLIIHAYKMRASDIHVNPTGKLLEIRYRIDGVMQEVFSFPNNIHSEVVSRMKILTGLRTDEHQTAQDGRFRVNIRTGEGENQNAVIDIRVSIVPTYYGENVVLRLLTDQSAAFTLEKLDFSTENLEKVSRALRKPCGMILSTGPTGSGKTTTLYTMIKRLNNKEVSIITIEDPIEYAIEGVKQTQVNHNSGLTFATGLRSFLRQDPDVIMVGEIRDVETANLAVNAALTGHLLLSTIHTNDAATTLPRLLDMEVDPFLVASTVNLALGQRLVRRIYREALAATDYDEDIAVDWAYWLEQQGDWEEAAAVWAEISEKHPHFQETADRAIERIDAYYR